MRSSINKQRSLFSFEACGAAESEQEEQADVFLATTWDRVPYEIPARGKEERDKLQSRILRGRRWKTAKTLARRRSVCERADCDIATVTGYSRELLRVTSRERRRKRTGRRARTRWIQVDNAREWEAYTRRTSARTLVRRRCARPLCLPARSRLLITQRRGEVFVGLETSMLRETESRADGAY